MKYVYVFVRQDLSLPQQAVQSIHAAMKARCVSALDTMPNLILIGVPDVRGLGRARQKLDRASIPYVCWHEPDNDLGFTSIATGPVGLSEKQVLKNYRLWKPHSSVAQKLEQPGSKDLADVGGNPAARTTSHLVSV